MWARWRRRCISNTAALRSKGKAMWHALNETQNPSKMQDLELRMNKTERACQVRGRLTRDEPMSRHSSWHAGGPARYYFEPKDLADLATYLAAIPAEEPLLWLGLGSNLLVRDGGFPGTVIATAGILDKLQIDRGGAVRVESGVASARVAKKTSRAGLTGAEFLVGIPGTMGGALAMNAGAFGAEIWDLVTSVVTLNRSGHIATRARQEFRVGYRHVSMTGDEWFISALLQLQPDAEGKSGQLLKEYLEKRAATQPVGRPSCGSVFRNPPGDYAARLIEACGLKGVHRGAACVSDKHANFIINRGGATATDIEQLIQHVQETVHSKYSVALEPEVKVVGNNRKHH